VSTKPVLSLVTGTRNRPVEFRRLVESIERNTPIEWELIVSDASDTPIDESGLPKNVIVIPERPRLGCTMGYNNAFREAIGTWVIWLNDDCEVLPGYATNAIRFMETNPQIGLGALYYREGVTDFHVNSYYNMVYANFGIIRKELGDRIGWFDNEIPMYGCDNALAFNVLLAGFGIDGIPDATLIHHAVNDQFRRENNETDTRIREAEFLRDKYGPRLPAIQHSYKITSSGQNTASHDQTPKWMWPKVTV
jgi:GT2 family glycosyltransferase